MVYFEPKNYELLLWRIGLSPFTDSREDMVRFQMAINDLIIYTVSVAKWQNQLQVEACSGLDHSEWLNANRKQALDRAVEATKKLCQLATKYDAEPMYTASQQYSHMVAHFSLEVTNWLFEQRDRLAELCHKEGSES